ncbi:hypothetical protein G7059_08895 [Erysipelothrix sp. HDW6A]|uniref:hypothetical protein n=1 Tax=Erysipelothrix sp. HDW6A TaxID=2714928 RepID=UPI001409711B|nr:hypothetical protein [Erysipelothrix sp. HDW6A]QIK57951.1 hypothetical protein G7059_08895 [Erysipelothrix sp. HDW6A]
MNVNNLITGEVITLGEIDKRVIYDSDKWEEITLLYDEADIINNDEYLYLEKKDGTQKHIEYKNFINTLY